MIGEVVRGKTGTFQKRRNDSVLQTGRNSATRVCHMLIRFTKNGAKAAVFALKSDGSILDDFVLPLLMSAVTSLSVAGWNDSRNDGGNTSLSVITTSWRTLDLTADQTQFIDEVVCETVRYSGWSTGVMRENAPTFTAEEVIGNSKHSSVVIWGGLNLTAVKRSLCWCEQPAVLVTQQRITKTAFVNILYIKVAECWVILVGLSISGYNPLLYIVSMHLADPTCYSNFSKSILKSPHINIDVFWLIVC